MPCFIQFTKLCHKIFTFPGNRLSCFSVSSPYLPAIVLVNGQIYMYNHQCTLSSNISTKMCIFASALGFLRNKCVKPRASCSHAYKAPCLQYEFTFKCMMKKQTLPSCLCRKIPCTCVVQMHSDAKMKVGILLLSHTATKGALHLCRAVIARCLF